MIQLAIVLISIVIILIGVIIFVAILLKAENPEDLLKKLKAIEEGK